MSRNSENQVVVCEGCGCKWHVGIGKGHAAINAKLLECPICESKEGNA